MIGINEIHKFIISFHCFLVVHEHCNKALLRKMKPIIC